MGYKSPCHGCVAPKRHPGCHDKCNEYKEWKAGEQAKKDAKRRQDEADSAMFIGYKPRRR